MLKKERSMFLPEVASVGTSLSKNPSLDGSMVHCLETYSGRQDQALELASGAVLVGEFPSPLCFSFLICTMKFFQFLHAGEARAKGKCWTLTVCGGH